MINNTQLFFVMFASFNPILVWLVFVNLPENINQVQKFLLVSSGFLLSFLILSALLLFGAEGLKAFGIQSYILEIGGGGLVLIIGVCRLLGNELILEVRYYLQRILNFFGGGYEINSNKLWLNYALEAGNGDDSIIDKINIIIRFGILILVNPVSVLIALHFSSYTEDNNVLTHLVIMMAALVLVALLTIVLTKLSHKHFEQMFILFINRLCGLFLMVIALEMFINGMKSIIPIIIT